MALTLDGTNGIVSSGSITTQSATGVIFSDSSSLPAASSPFSLKNRIINGDMVIDQRNAGASVTASSAGNFSLDRWQLYSSTTGKFTVQQNAASVTPPVGFTNYAGCTSTSAYSITSTDQMLFQQKIEGYNIADLGWGTANAKTVTLSFWVRSSLTGTFGGSLQNNAQNRCFPFSYTISAANTWEYKTITIPGDTTGTWLTTNGLGISVAFSLGTGATYSGTANAWTGTSFITSVTGAVSVVGTSGATFYITGVQLERNTTATPFEWLPFSTEMALCQRYYIQSYPYGTVAGTNLGSSGAGILGGVNYGATSFGYTMMGPFSFPVTMRTNASVTIYNSVTGSSTASVCIRNLNASTNVAGFVLSASDKQAYISCDNAPVTTRAECAITATAEI
jgi:hypothetical protein